MTLTIDFGGVEVIDAVEIVWAAVPKSFSVSVAESNEFVEIFNLDSNILNVTKINFDGRFAAKLQVALNQAHPITGKVANRDVYAIAAVRAVSQGPSLETVDCAAAAKSTDASDKVFMSQVLEFDPSSEAAYAGEAPSLQAAMASLTATVAELAQIVPSISSCGAAMLANTAKKVNSAAGAGASLDPLAADSLLAESRATILLARSALA